MKTAPITLLVLLGTLGACKSADETAPVPQITSSTTAAVTVPVAEDYEAAVAAELKDAPPEKLDEAVGKLEAELK